METVDAQPSLVDAQGRVRALVLAVGRPTDWAALSGVWQAVQSELGLPAPGIAVSGEDGYALWFSVAEPVAAREAAGFLNALRLRYLGQIAPGRIDHWPVVDAGAPGGVRHVATVPPWQSGAERWSACVAPDLAPVFAETPWLDIPPNAEGQAELLSGLRCIASAQWLAACEQLMPAQAAGEAAGPPASGDKGPYRDPRHFLLDVMNDGTVALALRIEAAKALLHGPVVSPAPPSRSLRSSTPD